MITCKNCVGAGQIAGPRWTPPMNWSRKPCPTCNGIGKAPNRMRQWIVCAKCEGWGTEPPLMPGPICPECSGLGMRSLSRAPSSALL